MRWLVTFSFATLVGCGAVQADPSDTLLSELVGFWQTESNPGVEPYAVHSRGFLMLGPDGRYSLAMVRHVVGEEPISINSMGRYDVDASRGLLVVHVEASTLSNRIGSERHRYITRLDASEIRWRASYGAPESIWRRVTH